MELRHLCSIGLVGARAEDETHIRAVDDTSARTLPKHSKRLSQQELLHLASQPVAIGRTARLQSGCLQDWPLWSKLQPQHITPVEVQVGGPMQGTAEQVSLVSWNILSQTWLTRSELDPEYARVERQWFDWQNRSHALIQWISRLGADIYVLQEVDFDTFDEAFLQPLSIIGYDGLIQDSPKRAEAQPCGNATFWRRDKLELVWSDHRSRTLLTEFRTSVGMGSQALIVINAHLESSQEKFSSRAAQVHSALEKAVRRNPSASLILAGDFNTGADSSLCRVLREHEWHFVPLASAYEHPAADGTSPVVDATFRVNGHGYLIDHIWYRHSHLRLCKLLQPLNADARAASLGMNALGLPDKHVPSDHIPLGAVFEINDRADSPMKGVESMSLEELCPSLLKILTLEQCNMWHKLQVMQPQQKPKGRPSQEELSALREAAAERKALEQTLLAGLNEEGQYLVQQIRSLRKKNSK
eukprot:TRINITY_DN63127_c0_g1_i1.p1 TRINITY_DN63127_c0_g1~~TRINITY_DN63127_c0_g1_i1.p1  ORF type:complete len:471 (-),score=38.73 TRINITY_DN63127_c0_g1_i1:386-1798(-)